MFMVAILNKSIVKTQTSMNAEFQIEVTVVAYKHPVVIVKDTKIKLVVSCY